jgi:hypothetical protein
LRERFVLARSEKGGEMVVIHSTVGALVVLGFLALTVVRVLALRGKEFSWTEMLSNTAGILLALQYALGFILLASGHHIIAIHYILALCAVFTLGFEHGYAMKRESAAESAKLGALATTGTLIIVLVTYIIGQSN